MTRQQIEKEAERVYPITDFEDEEVRINISDLDEYQQKAFIKAAEWMQEQMLLEFIDAPIEPAICEIDFGGSFKAQIEIKNNTITVLKAMNGYGQKVDPSEIQITNLNRP